jgi:hypothetical protein
MQLYEKSRVLFNLFNEEADLHTLICTNGRSLYDFPFAIGNIVDIRLVKSGILVTAMSLRG